MADHKVRIALEGEAASLDSATRRSASALGNVGAAVEKTNARMATLGATQAKTAEKAGLLTTTLQRAGGPLDALAKTSTKATASALQLGNAVFGVAKSFGPWGIAIGVAGDLLLGYIDGQREAEKATRAHTKAIKEQYAEELRANADEDARALDEKLAKARAANAKAAKHRQDLEIETRREELTAIENALAAHGRGRDTLSLQAEEVRIRAANLRTQEDIVGAVQLERDFELRTLELLNQQEKSRGRNLKAAKEAGASAGFAASLLGPNARGRSAASFTAGQQFGAGLQEATMARREGSDTREAGAVEARTNATLRAIEVERAYADTRTSFLGVELANHDAELGRIEAEKQARLDLLQVKLDASTIGAERMAIEQEMSQVSHEATLARIDAEKAAEQQRIAQIQAGLAVASNATQQTVAGLLSIRDARVSARNAALAQGKSDKEAARAGKIAALEQTAAQLQALRNLAIQRAIEQTAMGIGALASFNYPSAALHFAAAATWGAVGVGSGLASRAVASRATGMRRDDSMAANGVGGGGASGSRSGGAGGPSPNESPIPGSPGPSAPSSSGRGGGAVRTTVYQIGAVHTYGIPEREFLRRIDEGLSTEISGSRRRRAG